MSNRIRHFVVPLVVAILALYLLASDPVPHFADAVKAIPSIAASSYVEQVGERGELNELVDTVTNGDRRPVIFVADKGRDHRFRAFFASYALFPRRLIYAVPQPSRPQFDWWTECETTSDALRQLAEEQNAGSIIFWKTPPPEGMDHGEELMTLVDDRWVLFLP